MSATLRIDARQIDVRGPRFAAAVTTTVLAVVLLIAPHPVGIALLAAQAAVFALGAALGVRSSPYALVFAGLVRPRLSAASEFEDERPVRFAQTVGLAFALVGLIGFLAGLDILGQVAVGLALAAALLNAVFSFCLGCEMYLLAKRLTA